MSSKTVEEMAEELSKNNQKWLDGPTGYTSICPDTHPRCIAPRCYQCLISNHTEAEITAKYEQMKGHADE